MLLLLNAFQLILIVFLLVALTIEVFAIVVKHLDRLTVAQYYPKNIVLIINKVYHSIFVS